MVCWFLLDTSFLRYIIPLARECYGEILNTDQLVSFLLNILNINSLIHLLRQTSLIPKSYFIKTDHLSQALIPLGRCGWSGSFFVFYMVIRFLRMAFIAALYPILRIIWNRKSLSPFTSIRIFRRSHPSTLGSGRKLLIDWVDLINDEEIVIIQSPILTGATSTDTVDLGLNRKLFNPNSLSNGIRPVINEKRIN